MRKIIRLKVMLIVTTVVVLIVNITCKNVKNSVPPNFDEIGILLKNGLMDSFDLPITDEGKRSVFEYLKKSSPTSNIIKEALPEGEYHISVLWEDMKYEYIVLNTEVVFDVKNGVFLKNYHLINILRSQLIPLLVKGFADE